MTKIINLERYKNSKKNTKDIGGTKFIPMKEVYEILASHLIYNEKIQCDENWENCIFFPKITKKGIVLDWQIYYKNKHY